MSNTPKLRNSNTPPLAEGRDLDNKKDAERARPTLVQHGVEVQKYGHVVPLPIGLDESVGIRVVALLNQILADTISYAICTKSITGRCRARPSTNSICCLTSTIPNRRS